MVSDGHKTSDEGKRVVSYDEASQFVLTMGIGYFEVSARDRELVLLIDILRRRQSELDQNCEVGMKKSEWKKFL